MQFLVTTLDFSHVTALPVIYVRKCGYSFHQLGFWNSGSRWLHDGHQNKRGELTAATAGKKLGASLYQMKVMNAGFKRLDLTQ